MPQSRSPQPYLDVPFVALAHRGGFSESAPGLFENTMLAFRSAWAMGYRYLETDVHLTRDGVLVAFHDDVLDRVTDTTGLISELTWADVSAARIGGVEPVPRFADLLAAFPTARFNVDIKAPGVERPLAELIARHRAEDRVCVGSFNSARLRRFRGFARGRVATSTPPLEVVTFAVLRWLRAFVPIAGSVFQVPERDDRTGLQIVDRRMIEAAHRRGLFVHVWTVNDRASMERLIDLGVDGLITDDIATLKDVLIARNLWEGNA